jgi:hypothetical protein
MAPPRGIGLLAFLSPSHASGPQGRGYIARGPDRDQVVGASIAAVGIIPETRSGWAASVPAGLLRPPDQSRAVLQKPMPWSRKLAKPIVLKDGRTIESLDDARAVMRSLPASRLRSEPWFYVGALLQESATFQGALSETQVHLTQALKAEGLI